MTTIGIRRGVWIAIAILGVGMLAFWLMPRAEQASTAHSAGALQPAAGASLAGPPASAEHSAIPVAPSTPRGLPQSAHQNTSLRPVTPEAQLLRRRVLDSLRSLHREHSPEGSNVEHASAAPSPGTMVDRTGMLGKDVMHVVNHELIPLVDECYQQARERRPQLRGMLAVGVKLAGAEELGAVFEDVAPAPRNEVDDEELIECVRQSAFSVQLPAPSKSGRTDFEMTIPLGDPALGDGGS